MTIHLGTIKRILLGTAVAASVALLAACGSSKTSSSSSFKDDLINKNELTVGLEGTYAPYSYRKDGKLVGFEVDLGKALAKQLGVKAKFAPTKWDSLIAGLGSGKFDVVLNNIVETPERAKSYLFSSTYAYSHYVLISSSSKPLTKISQIKGKKFGQSTGSDNATVAKKNGATVVPVEQFSTILDMVKDGRVDGTINALPTWYAYKQQSATSGLKMTKLPDSAVAPAKTAALINKKDTKLQKRINKALAVLKKNGTTKKISEKYFGTDITK